MRLSLPCPSRAAQVLPVLSTVLLAIFTAAPAVAEVRVAHVFGDHMVLQRQREVPVWGWADAGEAVTVSIAGQTLETQADESGYWRVDLEPLPEGEPLTMTVSGPGNVIELSDVLVGEVWFCSGQSNMDMKVGANGEGSGVSGVLNVEEELANAEHPELRLFNVDYTWSQTPVPDAAGQWTECNAETAAAFSATAYFFGRDLQQELDVPVGLMVAAIGGMPIEQFTPPPDQAFWYNGMIAPLMPYAIRGAIWYQGETNLADGMQYYDKQVRLIEGWRKNWGQGQFPVYFAQLAPFEYGGWPVPDPKPYFLPLLWEAQTATLEVPNTGMIVTTDIGEVDDIHPRNKQDVGHRLCLWALANTYGQEDLVYSGPLFDHYTIDGDKIRLFFNHAGSGLASRDGEPLDWFTVAGDDREFLPAEAVIEGDTVVVSAEGIEEPVAVRFGWDQTAQPNLMNVEGLPASPFRTDRWEQEEAAAEEAEAAE